MASFFKRKYYGKAKALGFTPHISIPLKTLIQYKQKIGWSCLSISNKGLLRNNLPL